MPKYIDSEALKRDLIDNRNFYPAIVANAIEHAPACDVVEVVRCKDCRWTEAYKRMDNRTGYYCLFREHSFKYGMNGERTFHPIKEPDDFCSNGERKEEKND